jgi:GNAT superfamily N-acetyltransferase
MILTDLEASLNEYSLIKVSEDILDDVFEVMRRNEYFISRTQAHDVTIEECRDDICALPPGTDLSQKSYIALYKGKSCAALLDYVEGYPAQSTVFIGLFILDPAFQNAGNGAHIINALIKCAGSSGFKEIMLGCYEANETGLKFWNRMGFKQQSVSVREADGKPVNLIKMSLPL